MFQCVSVIVLPIFFGLNGVWAAIIVAELASLALTIVFLVTNARKYGYGKTSEEVAVGTPDAITDINVGNEAEEAENGEE